MMMFRVTQDFEDTNYITADAAQLAVDIYDWMAYWEATTGETAPLAAEILHKLEFLKAGEKAFFGDLSVTAKAAYRKEILQ